MSGIKQKQAKPRKKFINSLNYFRGIAIIFIVLGHSYDLSHWEINNLGEKTIYALTQNGSVFFLFISGFLFHHIFYTKFNYSQFMLKKAKYVLLPYLIISIIPILITYFYLEGGEFLPEELNNKPILALFWYLITGRVFIAYWYIPVAMILYSLSPAVIWLIDSKLLLKTILFLLPISLIVHRPVLNLNPLHSTVYFFPIYLLGVWSSINRERIYTYLSNKRIIVLLLVLCLAIWQSTMFATPGNFHKDFWQITVPDINLVQKILLCFFLMSLLDLFEHKDIEILKKTAEVSFPIYFIHPVLVYIGAKLTSTLNLDYQGNLLTLLVVTCLLLFVSMAIAYSVKQVFGRNSRYLIGW